MKQQFRRTPSPLAPTRSSDARIKDTRFRDFTFGGNHDEEKGGQEPNFEDFG